MRRPFVALLAVLVAAAAFAIPGRQAHAATAVDPWSELDFGSNPACTAVRLAKLGRYDNGVAYQANNAEVIFDQDLSDWLSVTTGGTVTVTATPNPGYTLAPGARSSKTFYAGERGGCGLGEFFAMDGVWCSSAKTDQLSVELSPTKSAYRIDWVLRNVESGRDYGRGRVTWKLIMNSITIDRPDSLPPGNYAVLLSSPDTPLRYLSHVDIRVINCVKASVGCTTATFANPAGNPTANVYYSTGAMRQGVDVTAHFALRAGKSATIRVQYNKYGQFKWSAWDGPAWQDLDGWLSQDTKINRPASCLKGLSATTPTIKGKRSVGHKLSASFKNWRPGPVHYTYRWLRDGKAVKAATHKSYRVTPEDRHHKLRVQVTGSKAGYRTTSRTSPNKTIR